MSDVFVIHKLIRQPYADDLAADDDHITERRVVARTGPPHELACVKKLSRAIRDGELVEIRQQERGRAPAAPVGATDDANQYVSPETVSLTNRAPCASSPRRPSTTVKPDHQAKSFSVAGPLADWQAIAGGRAGIDMGGYPAVTVDRQGFVYVALDDQHIQKLSPAGQRVGGPWGTQGGPAEFDEPRGVAVDNVGNIYMAEWGKVNRVQKLRRTPP